jgi:cytochrome c-type biogenesis protein CcmH/NrfG
MNPPAAYRNAIQYSTDVPTMILVADVMQSQQKYLESEQLLRRALKEDDRNPTALFLLGRALTTRASYEEAEKVLKKSAEISPNSFVSYALLGSMSMRRGNSTMRKNT